MFIKFAIDTDLEKDRSQPSFYMYGGSSGARHDLAMKAATHELQAAIQYSKDIPENFSVPMQCIIDYQGFRVVRMNFIVS